ncbi:hypothetical protein MMC28_009034 [Mycoblastus sanguinarius]|nr:hypothetical protein [Mycoblastus sanguinarius]
MSSTETAAGDGNTLHNGSLQRGSISLSHHTNHSRDLDGEQPNSDTDDEASSEDTNEETTPEFTRWEMWEMGLQREVWTERAFMEYDEEPSQFPLSEKPRQLPHSKKLKFEVVRRMLQKLRFTSLKAKGRRVKDWILKHCIATRLEAPIMRLSPFQRRREG